MDRELKAALLALGYVIWFIVLLAAIEVAVQFNVPGPLFSVGLATFALGFVGFAYVTFRRFENEEE